jgi:hypothetical protein
MAMQTAPPANPAIDERMLNVTRCQATDPLRGC